MKANLIIRASAGTGKTFSLATRFIRLMLFQDVEPKTIVALTFSRAAAKEIYTKLLERLWKAALSEKGAAAEKALLLKGLDAQDLAVLEQKSVTFTPAKFAELLRKTVDSQEVGAIATLDSFILRIVRSFPLEMGFQYAVDVLDGFGERRATQRVGAELLANDADETDARRQQFTAAFKATQRETFLRTCQSVFDKIINGWHGFLVEHPEAKDWTAASMCAALGIPETLERPSVEGLSATGNNAKYFTDFKERVQAFDGTAELFPDNKLGEMMRFFVENPEETVWAYDTTGKKPQHKVCDCGAAGAAAVRASVQWMANLILKRQVEVVAAKLALCKMFEGDYDAATRRRGQLTFADFTHCQALAEGGANPLALENIQYRFDERFNHWALDEFQDTSKLQWKCLARLVQEAASGEQRSVMVVGDLKQSIYGWRGGDDGPFRAVMAMGEFQGEQGESLKNDTSYRYEQHTVDFINRVFGPSNLRDSSVLQASCADAVASWLGEGCWMEHKADVYGAGHPRAGQPKDGDFVEIVRVPKETESEEGTAIADEEVDDGTTCSAAMKTLAPKICTLVQDLWQRHETLRDGQPSKDTIGILVRNNTDGAYLAERIRAIPGTHIPVVWEGANPILDTPVVQAVLELVKLAAHPEDTYAWQTVDRLFSVRQLVFPDLANVGAVSRKMCEMLTRQGLSRTLRAVVTKLTVAEAGLSARSVACLEALLRLAVAFESREEGGAAIEEFPKFLEASAGRESGESSRVVRILTIHRSKGLTLDHVIVPIPEAGKTAAITRPDKRQRLEGAGWALDMVSADLGLGNRVLAQALKAKADEHFMEQLRLYYVALTRARKSTSVFVVQDDHAGVVQFRDLLLAPFTGAGAQEPVACDYGEVVFSDGTPYSFAYPKEGAAAESGMAAPWVPAAGRPFVGRRTPSAAGSAVAVKQGAKSLAAFFTKDFAAAAQRGVDTHAAYATIEWVDPAAPKDAREKQILATDFYMAFVKPEATATVWRERGYELFDEQEGAWESGQFDRVVFTGEGTNRAATIYDFKTNARRANETEESFVERMRTLYATQMGSYRRALSRLTGIPPARISACLLLESTGQIVSATGGI